MPRKVAKTATLIQTFVFVDGPQLALFKTSAGLNMLATAIGELTWENRFFGVEVRDKDFRSYKHGKVDLNYLYRFSPGRRYFELSWSEINGLDVNISAATKSTIKDDQNYPDRGFFAQDHTEAWLSTPIPTVKRRFGLDGRWDAPEFSRLYNKIGDMYSFLSVVTDLESDDLAEVERSGIISALSDPTWGGGGSYTGFYAKAAKHAQDMRPLRVSGMKYHSPGHIEVEGRQEILDDILRSVASFNKNFDVLRLENSAIGKVLTAEKLKKADKSADFSSDALRALMLKRSDNLARMLLVSNPDALFHACGNNTLVFAKVVLSYYRRIRDLNDFQREGRLSVEYNDVPRSPQINESVYGIEEDQELQTQPVWETE